MIKSRVCGFPKNKDDQCKTLEDDQVVERNT